MRLTRRGGIAGAATLAVLIAVGVVLVSLGGITHHLSPGAVSSAAPQGAKPGAGATWVQKENARGGTTAWRVSGRDVASDAELSAYADHASVLPGQPVRLFVSSSAPTISIDAYRIGWYGGRRGRLVWHQDAVPAHLQTKTTTDPATRMISAPWTPTLTVTTRSWPEGLYLFKLTGAHGHKRYVPLVIRSADTKGRLVLVSATVTDEAYNTWGGRSLYGEGTKAEAFSQRSFAVSMDRPYDGSGIRKLSQYELGPVAVAESTGLNLAYLSSADVELPHVLAGARGVVSLGHDEYWTLGMRRAVTAARDAGTNLAFLGANTSYWRVRLEPSPLGPDRVVIGYKSASLDPEASRDPAQATAMWRARPSPDPENSLTGMLYECYPTRADYVVTTPDFPLFKGTGVHRGTRLPGLVGAEIDRVYPISGTPQPLELVGHSPARCGTHGETYSDSVYFTSPSGAGTFSTGTMSWAIALAGPERAFGITSATVDFTRTVTRNLFEAMARGPMARTTPVDDNARSFALSSSTATGTGGPVG